MPFSDLTPEQQNAFNARLKELQIDPSKVLKSITPETFKGPVVFSADPRISSVPPTIVTVTSLDETKRIAGNPDSHFESGMMAEHHEVQPPWPQELNGAPPGGLTPEQNRRIIAAEMAYIYGNSKHHASYKAIIEQQKYPADFAVFAVEDVVVDATNPLIIKSDSAFNFGIVTIKEGGSIKYEANATMTIQKMIKASAA